MTSCLYSRIGAFIAMAPMRTTGQLICVSILKRPRKKTSEGMRQSFQEASTRVSFGGESRPMYLENIQSDYRRVPGSSMYESYHQVMKMAGPSERDSLREMPLVVIGKRTVDRAVHLGFKKPVLLADEASDQGIVDKLIEWRAG